MSPITVESAAYFILGIRKQTVGQFFKPKPTRRYRLHDEYLRVAALAP